MVDVHEEIVVVEVDGEPEGLGESVVPKQLVKKLPAQVVHLLGVLVHSLKRFSNYYLFAFKIVLVTNVEYKSGYGCQNEYA